MRATKQNIIYYLKRNGWTETLDGMKKGAATIPASGLRPPRGIDGAVYARSLERKALQKQEEPNMILQWNGPTVPPSDMPNDLLDQWYGFLVRQSELLADLVDNDDCPNYIIAEVGVCKICLDKAVTERRLRIEAEIASFWT